MAPFAASRTRPTDPPGMITFPSTPGVAWSVSTDFTSRDPDRYPLASAEAVNSALRLTFKTQGERGQSCPSEVRIRAEAGLAVMVTVSSIPRVTVLQAARDRTVPAAHPSTLVCMDCPFCRGTI